jgi:hypothetical protein
MILISFGKQTNFVQVDGERRMEVEYVDRDRAAAVVIGTKDIVNDLKSKKRRERMENANAILLEEEVDMDTYLAQGEHELKYFCFLLNANSC